MLYLILLLFICFLIGLPFVLLYLWIKKKKQPNLNSNQNQYQQIFVTTTRISPQEVPLNNDVHYTFMDDYSMWKNLNLEEKKERLMDIEVIFREAKDHIKNEMIKQGFQPGTKIIDIKYFTGLSEFGFTIAGFLVQNEAGGEIRELVINIDLQNMKFVTTRNAFHSTGLERYFYLKNRKGLVEL